MQRRMTWVSTKLGEDGVKAVDKILSNWTEAGWTLEHVTTSGEPWLVGGLAVYTLFWRKDD